VTAQRRPLPYWLGLLHGLSIGISLAAIVVSLAVIR
jgi:hypothetical protein